MFNLLLAPCESTRQCLTINLRFCHVLDTYNLCDGGGWKAEGS